MRRELGLSPVAGAPADRLEAELSEPVDDARTPGASGVLGPGSVSILEQLLTMPRARLLVDGYNVSKGAWEGSSLEAQRQRLLRSLAPLVARTGVETTVVFDAANLTSRPVVAAPRGVKVLFSPPGVIADDVIRDLVAAEPPGGPSSSSPTTRRSSGTRAPLAPGWRPPRRSRGCSNAADPNKRRPY